MSKARENRLEQNRKAARESRRRKKLMIEELQRSVIFFSKANGTLKMQNDELSRRFMEAQTKVAVIERKDKKKAESTEKKEETQESDDTKPKHTEQSSAPEFRNEQVKAQAVATQAMYESQGFPAGAARAAAQAMNAPNTVSTVVNTPSPAVGVPQMQPGATMQAMAAFQQAAAAAMQAALGMNPTAAGNQQQAYAQAMTALAQQQSREAPQFSGSQQQAMPQALMAFNPMAMQMAWQQQQAATKNVSAEERGAQQKQVQI
mmetsp:Transcript_17648/g.26790  ORF Transcript_17648/g.26790 Transcript_17648/m.26790 type:complete len:261 (-) Transcript_17648:71-853(-)